MITALAFERNAMTELLRKTARPRARGNHDRLGRHALCSCQWDVDAVRVGSERLRLASAQAPAQLGEAAREGLRQQQRIGDRLPARQEGGRHQRGRGWS